MKETDADREHRIEMEIIVDAYGADEQAIGWYYYLERQITFPFVARCIEISRGSLLQLGETATVTSLSPEEDCERDMRVQIDWQGRTVGIPLSQVEPVEGDAQTQEAIGDWHYWVNAGYEFG